MFTDQRWVDFVPSFFEHYILKDPGYNVAYWNLHGRELRAESDGYLVDGAPLRFFHFSGFDPRRPWLLSKHQGERPRVLLSERPVLAAICDDYRLRLEAHGATANGKQPYGWGRLPSGLPLTPRMRRLYWDAVVEAEQGKGPEPPGPFDVDHPDAFVRWLNTPSRRGPRGVSRFLFSIYEERPDLRVAFPDVSGRDAGAFANWVTSDGMRQEEIPEELLPRREPPASELGDADGGGRRQHRRLLPRRAGDRRSCATAGSRGRGRGDSVVDQDLRCDAQPPVPSVRGSALRRRGVRHQRRVRQRRQHAEIRGATSGPSSSGAGTPRAIGSGKSKTSPRACTVRSSSSMKCGRPPLSSTRRFGALAGSRCSRSRCPFRYRSTLRRWTAPTSDCRTRSRSCSSSTSSASSNARIRSA